MQRKRGRGSCHGKRGEREESETPGCRMNPRSSLLGLNKVPCLLYVRRLIRLLFPLLCCCIVRTGIRSLVLQHARVDDDLERGVNCLRDRFILDPSRPFGVPSGIFSFPSVLRPVYVGCSTLSPFFFFLSVEQGKQAGNDDRGQDAAQITSEVSYWNTTGWPVEYEGSTVVSAKGSKGKGERRE